MAKKVVKTYIDEDKKVVVTKIKVRDFCFDDFFMEERTYTGKAKCSPEDTFDVELGKKISLARAWMKYDVAKLKELQEINTMLNKDLMKNQKEIDKQIDLIDRTENKINELVDSTEE